MVAKTHANSRLKPAEALMALLAEQSWHRITLSDIAERSGMTLAELRAQAPCKEALLTALAAEIDRKVLDEKRSDSEAGLPVRDRLFDVLMRRLEALAPYKQAFKRLAKPGGASPGAVLAILLSIDRAMPWMLEAAGVASSGLTGQVKAKALAAAYLSAVKVWLEDDTADQGPTMGALDKALSRCESLLALVPKPLRSCLTGEKPVEKSAIAA